MLSVSNGTTTVQPETILSATLEGDLRRTVGEVPTLAPAIIATQTPGLLSGQIVYLCTDLAAALALHTLYKGTATVTLSTGAGQALNGFKHLAVDKVRLQAERATHGNPAKWTCTVQVRERTI